ncbi:MAG: Mrp/NBP35 family ATP-binding protein [Alphaproteobacteria bacterium]|nr:Mrp/NBP35 family ATP-binding protein [Alphaproteobacteria bacterium]
MTSLTSDSVLEQLKSIRSPVTGGDIVSLCMVSDILIEEGKVVFSIKINPAQEKEMESVRQAAQEVVEKMPEVTSVLAVLTAEKKPSSPQQPVNDISKRPVAPQVKHIIAVASGKGGVGKSTIAANLALAFVEMGKKTGLLDADIYGASQPRMMGVRPRPDANEDDMVVPPTAHGLKVMSIGFFMDEISPVLWRGPMVHGAIQQLLRDIEWGDLDVLVIDMPPGTGDAHLSIVQNVLLSGVVIVSTPQDVALSEAKKGMMMFQKVNVPVLGLIENMSYHICSSCGHREDIFDHGKVRAAAQKMNIEFLGEIPLNSEVRAAADIGTPLVSAKKDHVISETFRNIASSVWTSLSAEKVGCPAEKSGCGGCCGQC